MTVEQCAAEVADVRASCIVCAGLGPCAECGNEGGLLPRPPQPREPNWALIAAGADKLADLVRGFSATCAAERVSHVRQSRQAARLRLHMEHFAGVLDVEGV